MLKTPRASLATAATTALPASSAWTKEKVELRPWRWIIGSRPRAARPAEAAVGGEHRPLAVELAEPEDRAARLQRQPLELGDRLRRHGQRVAGIVAERHLLAGGALSGAVDEGDALRDEPGAASRLGRVEEDPRALGPEPVRRRELGGDVTAAGLGRDLGREVDDGLRTPVGGEREHGVAVEQVERDDVLLPVRVPGEAADLVAGGPELRHRRTAQHPGGAGDDYAHGLISVLRPTSGSSRTRRDGEPRRRRRRPGSGSARVGASLGKVYPQEPSLNRSRRRCCLDSPP